MLARKINPDGVGNRSGGYNQVCLCYEGLGKVSEMVAQLEHGLEQLRELLPWISGYSKMSEKTGKWYIEGHADLNDQLSVALRPSAQPAIARLRSAKMETRWFDEQYIAPCPTYKQEYKHPVFLAQLNAIEGGVLLVFCVEKVFDTAGMNLLLSLLNKACLSLEITASEIDTANLLAIHVPEPFPSASNDERWLYFAFKNEAEILKTIVTDDEEKATVAEVVSAFILRAFAESISAWVSNSSVVTVNINNQSVGASIEQLASESLGNTTHRFHSTHSNPHPVSSTHHHVTVHNWYKCEAYNWTFGLNKGEPLRVIRPTYTSSEPVAYILPPIPESGGSLVGLCLATRDYEGLVKSSTFKEFAREV